MPELSRTERFDLLALHETSRLLSGSLDLEFVLNNLLLTAMSKLLVARGVVLLEDPVAQAWRVAAVKGVPGVKSGSMFRFSFSGEAEVVQGGAVPAALAEKKIGLLLPLQAAHRQIGWVGLGAKLAGTFSEEEIRFLQSLVHMSAAAVQNAVMVEELQQANRDLDGKIQELNTLFDLSQAFAGTLDRDQLVKLLSFALMGQLLVRRHLFLLRRTAPGKDGCLMEVVVAKGLTNLVLGADLDARLCCLDTLMRLDEAGFDPVFQPFAEAGLHLVLPLRMQGETRGLLALGPKPTGQVYTPGDVEFLFALGNLALSAIQNTYLVEERIARERLEEDMRLARRIQEGLLPSSLPRVPGVEVAALSVPSRHVGGDYYDAALLQGGRLLMAIADVTGKGVPAALLMANLQAASHVLFPIDISLEDATSVINGVICENTDASKFITFFHGIYHPETRRFDYINAGHNPPVVVRSAGHLEKLEEGGLLLGVMKGMPYGKGSVQLEVGDVVVMFTDGVTEAMNAAEEEYDDARLEALLPTIRSLGAQEMLDVIHEDVRKFIGTVPLGDDLTMVVMKVV